MAFLPRTAEVQRRLDAPRRDTEARAAHPLVLIRLHPVGVALSSLVSCKKKSSSSCFSNRIAYRRKRRFLVDVVIEVFQVPHRSESPPVPRERPSVEPSHLSLDFSNALDSITVGIEDIGQEG